jgi:hypothetical protein
MKKYLLGLSAIVLAIAFSAFTRPTTFANEKFFKLRSAINLTEAYVENIANWQYVATTPICDGVEEGACRIFVSDIYYHTDALETYKLNTMVDQENQDDEIAVVRAAITQGQTQSVPEISKVVVSDIGGTTTAVYFTNKNAF